MGLINKIASVAIVAMFMLCQGAAAESKMEKSHTAGAGGLELSPELKDLLTLEMQSIQTGMIDILGAIPAGDWDKVAETADKIAKSFIMKQKLSPEQFKELATSLPLEFRKLDNRFHTQAAMLSHVARERHVDLVNFYFYKMTESCVECHSGYATSKFPKLKTGGMDHGKHDDHHKP
ncbi:hypothetical protein MNBD_NITROSPINAE02-1223 [hydrothermal vent metagenome]|uniref:Cytochrome c n=1 Tax=hydrothermal vent metagenome TaxID=652676 RepID=A0A3B1BP94_9ZZZZ